MNEYYIPSIEEFVQGFKFEYLDIRDYELCWFNLSDNSKETISSKHIEEWLPTQVTYKNNPTEIFEFPSIIKETGEIESIWRVSGSFLNFYNTWSDNKIIKYLKDGRIRAKR